MPARQMTVACKVCGAETPLPEDSLPDGWAFIYKDDYLDEAFCPDHDPGDHDPGPVPEGEPEQTFMDVWAALAPGRAARGVYSIYKDAAGALIIAYRPEGAAEDGHLTIPAGMIKMMAMAAEGKGPLGKLAAFAARRQA